MTQHTFEQMFDQRGGAGTTDHCEVCGVNLNTEDCQCWDEEEDQQ